MRSHGPKSEIRLSERAEHPVDAFSSGRVIGEGSVDGGDPDTDNDHGACDITGLP